MTRILCALPFLTIVACADDAPDERLAEDLVFVAVEEDGALAVLDGATGEVLRTVDVSEDAHGERVRFDLHNVQAEPDGGTVWLTAMPADADAGHNGDPMPEQLIGVDAISLSVTRRIELGADLHAAHVVVAGSTAYVTANETDAIVVVDLAGGTVVRSIPLPNGTGPHGARVTRDGATLVVAGMGDGSLHVIDTATDEVTSHDLPGRAVQTAISPDGTTAFATVYDTRQVARLDLTGGTPTLVDMPAGSAGPVQIYPSPDGRSIWVADQGMLDGDPAGNALVALDATTGEVLRVATVDPAPHGVVLDEHGTKAWTTTLVRGTVQSVDTATGEVLSTAAVGNSPNGISCMHLGGAMP